MDSTLSELTKSLMRSITGSPEKGGSPAEEQRDVFVFDRDAIKAAKLAAYRAWYSGQETEIYNFYHEAAHAGVMWSDPIYFSPWRQYFWARVSEEDGVKMTHSGQPQNLIDTTAALIGRPYFAATLSNGKDGSEYLADGLAGSGFWDAYETAVPMAMVEGWGCLKLSFDRRFSDHPYFSYVGAEDVDFAKVGGRIVGIVFRDWYGSGADRWVRVEARAIRRNRDGSRSAVIATRCYRQLPVSGSDAVLSKGVPPELEGCESTLEIKGCDDLFAYPILFRRSTDPRMFGASFFEGKLPLFDDLDQELSQESNCVRLSTPEELFNTDFLEVNPETGLPKEPSRYDRRYVMYVGGKNSDGTPAQSAPVQVTQPQLNLSQYSEAAVQTMSHICSGWLSLATLGIEVATQATEKSQREKERVTKSTRDSMIAKLKPACGAAARGWMRLDSYMRDGAMTEWGCRVDAEFPDFASTSFDERIASCGEQLANGNLSPQMFMEKVYMRTLTDSAYGDELEYLRQMHQTPEEQQEQQMEQEAAMQQAQQGAEQGGDDENPEETQETPSEAV